MPHEIRRVLRAFAATPWFIEPRKAEQLAAMLEFRASNGPRPEPYRAQVAEPPAPAAATGQIAVLRLRGVIAPRLSGSLDDVSDPPASMEAFGQAFDRAAGDPNIAAIVIDVDSPGGAVDLVPETAARIRAARRESRPIVAVANTLAASAAYWIASAADELVVTPSGEVGSIGVYMLHQDISAMLEAEGVRMTFLREGPRKVEGNPFEPLSEEARGALQTNVRHYYDMFVKDVARHRSVPQAVVRADPEKGGRHFGGGRSYPAAMAVDLGLADRVATFEETVARLQGGGRRGRRADLDRRRLALI